MDNAAPTTPRIDHAFDTSLADRLAHFESYNKHLYRPNSYLHKWWARRCGSTFRLLLKHLVADKACQDYYASGGLEGKVILDPMIGGGTTLHEAIRLGANVIGADIDPIPIVQARATLSPLTLAELKPTFDAFYQTLRTELISLFSTSCPHCAAPTDLRFMLYGWQRACRCGPALFVDSLILYREADGRTINLCPRCHQVHHSDRACGCPDNGNKAPILEKGVKSCPTCVQPYEEDLATPFYARYRPLVVAGYCPRHHLFFKSPDRADLAMVQQADAQRPSIHFAHSPAVVPGPKSVDLLRRGVTDYRDLFSSRQLRYLHSAIHHLAQIEPAHRLPLALLVSTSLEFNAMLCGYKGAARRRPGAIRHVFSYHAYSFPYTALENNPIAARKSSGTLGKLFHDRLRRGRLWAMKPQERVIEADGRRVVEIPGELDVGQEVESPAALAGGSRRFLLMQRSAAHLPLPDDSVDYVITDPPYFDSVQYSDLAAFFRVWLRQLLPGEVAGVDWHYAEGQSAVAVLADRRKQGLDDHYTGVMGAIFGECRRVLRPENGRLIFTYHHWQAKGWAAITQALKTAGFILVNRYVVHAENPSSVHITNFKALTHDAILVLAPAEEGARTVWERPVQINDRDSAHFCADCAALLGWLLNSTLSATEIEATWRDYLP